MSEFKIALRETLENEGGYSNDAVDAGGETNHGITIEVARAHGYTGNMKDIDMDTIEKIYKMSYWDPIKLDKIESQKVSNKLFDIAVNMGTKKAAIILQKTVNILNRNEYTFSNLKVDGVIGPRSLRAINKLLPYEEKYVLYTLTGYQLYKYISICEKKESQERFIRGWMKRAFKNII